MASKEINFTKKTLEDIVPPSKNPNASGGRYDTYKDSKQKGLILVVSNGGAKTFYFYSKINGKPERVRLGSFPAMPVDKARKKAAATRLQIDSGTNPQQERQSMRKEITFGEVVEEYVERHAKRHNKKWQDYDRDLKRFAAHWLNRKLSSITNNDIRKLHEQITDNNGAYQANRVYEKIRAVFNKAIEWGWDGKNPAVGVTKNKEKSRDRFLYPDEMQKFLEAVRDEENTTARDYILLSLLTGARRSNVLAMRWEDINFSIQQWRIPDTKNGEPHIIPLSNQAMDILNARKKQAQSEWVFASTGAKGHLNDPKKAWKRICNDATIRLWESDEQLAPLVAETKAKMSKHYTVQQLITAIQKAAEEKKAPLPVGLLDVRLHDLRRTLGSWQAAQGATAFVIGKSLGHKSQAATSVYARLDLDPVRNSVQSATDAMFGVANAG